MSTLTVNKDMREILQDLREVTELVDGDGKRLGLFTPTRALDNDLLKKAQKAFDPAEGERHLREEHGKGKPQLP
jgi:hypothetical protein